MNLTRIHKNWNTTKHRLRNIYNKTTCDMCWRKCKDKKKELWIEILLQLYNILNDQSTIQFEDGFNCTIILSNLSQLCLCIIVVKTKPAFGPKSSNLNYIAILYKEIYFELQYQIGIKINYMGWWTDTFGV